MYNITNMITDIISYRRKYGAPFKLGLPCTVHSRDLSDHHHHSSSPQIHNGCAFRCSALATWNLPTLLTVSH